MNMKRQISICIILAIIVLILALVYIKINNQTNPDNGVKNTENVSNPTEETNTESITSSNEYVTYYFCAKNESKRVVIYDVKSQTIYMETSIETSLLTEDMQKALETGIYFKTEEELFDFLESYSS